MGRMRSIHKVSLQVLGQTGNPIAMVNIRLSPFITTFLQKCVLNWGHTIMCNTKILLCLVYEIIYIAVFVSIVVGDDRYPSDPCPWVNQPMWYNFINGWHTHQSLIHCFILPAISNAQIYRGRISKGYFLAIPPSSNSPLDKPFITNYFIRVPVTWITLKIMSPLISASGNINVIMFRSRMAELAF